MAGAGWTVYVLVLVVLWGWSPLPGWAGTPCPKFCSCRKGVAKCNGRGNLTEVPPLPENIRVVVVDNATFDTLSPKTFRHLRTSRLVGLELWRCGINTLQPDAFSSMRSLRTLALSYGSIPASQISQSLSAMNDTNLRELTLYSLELDDLPLDYFQLPCLRNLTSLYLGGNSFSVFNDTLLQPLSHLDKVDLSNCRLDEWHGLGHANLSNIILTQNKFVSFPNFCSREGTSLYPNLRILVLKENSLYDLAPTTFSCASTVEFLDLSNNKMVHLRHNTFSRLPKLRKLYLNQNKQLGFFEERAFNSSSLHKLQLMYNQRWTEERISPDLFRWCPNLKELYMKQTKMGLTESFVQRLLLPLKNIEYLNLASSNTYFIPKDLFPYLPRLERLDMASNRINKWDADVFRGARRLQHLSLSENNIQMMTEASFPPELWRNLRHINLARNPFNCICDLRWWAKWLEDVHTNRSVVVDNYPKDYKCRVPEALRDLPLKSYRPSWFDCLSPYTILSAVLPPVFVILVIVIALLYRYRINVKLWVYLLCRKRKGYERVPGQNFLFEAFIAYSKDDSAWVVEEILPLENELGVKLCIHQRDFKAGWLVVDNIMGSMEASRRVLLIVSNSFAGSEWCQFELQEALEYFLKKRKQVVLVVLEPIEARHLTRPLRLLMEKTTYLEWRDCHSARKLLRERLTEPFEPEVEA